MIGVIIKPFQQQCGFIIMSLLILKLKEYKIRFSNNLKSNGNMGLRNMDKTVRGFKDCYSYFDNYD